jgi:pimeloyl-ACP methyl ester carboxylesterase
MLHPAPVVKNIVLVHGAFADGTSWSRIIPLLGGKGYYVVAVQNPLTSLADDAAAARRIIALQDGPVILVGHSWGGAVITHAGDDPKVAALVYVSAYARMWDSLPTTPAPRSDGPKARSRFAWVAITLQPSHPKACWKTSRKGCQWQTENLRLRFKARVMPPCSTKS